MKGECAIITAILRRVLSLKQIKTKLIAAVLVSAVFLVGLAAVASPAKADQFDDQINALKAKVRETQQQAAQKAAEANTLKSKLASIDAEIYAAQTALSLTNSQINNTQAEIDKANRDLDRQKAILKDNLRLVYKQGEVSPLELIASSKNLSDFVAQSQYLNAIKNKINSNLKKIDQLKQELNAKQGQLNALAGQQKATYDQIASQRAEQQSILARTQGEEANYKAVAAEDNKKIASLRQQQAAVIASYSSNVSYGGTGGYPWANVNPFPSFVVDSWGMYARQCVSYTAWRVATSGKTMPYWGGRGNANQWDDNARAAGIPVDGTPRVGDIAVSNSGPYGHVMYVESLNGNGTVRVSQYNAANDGRYSVSDVSIAGLLFIHF
jgi:surface antigen